MDNPGIRGRFAVATIVNNRNGALPMPTWLLLTLLGVLGLTLGVLGIPYGGGYIASAPLLALLICVCLYGGIISLVAGWIMS
ncbi:MAG: hypothetical protein RLZZ416_610 [Candidatus Parcubacteria bacterium]|jgi:asparagine N-glycosylation enzyme membrane subunit Stt3